MPLTHEEFPQKTCGASRGRNRHANSEFGSLANWTTKVSVELELVIYVDDGEAPSKRKPL
jgi:hypothetical protein